MANPYRRNGEEAVRGSNPVSAHPAFPALVALWFAVLLGLGSLVLPLSLFERIISLTGLAEILPPAAPPLGGTAKFAIAFGAAIVGCLGGWILGRRLSSRPSAHHEELQEMRRRNLKARQAREPFQASQELGEEGFDGPSDVADDVPDLADSTSYADQSGEGLWQEAEHQPATPIYDHSEEAEFAEFSEIEPEDHTPQSVAASFDARLQQEGASPQYEAEPELSGKLAELDNMGLVQLAERLGQAIEARRIWLQEKQLAAAQEESHEEERPSSQPSPMAQSALFGRDLLAAEAEEARMAMAAYFSRPQDKAETDDQAAVDANENADFSSGDGEPLINSLSLPLAQHRTAMQELREDSDAEPAGGGIASPMEGQRLSLVSSSDDLPKKPKPLARLKARRRHNVTPDDQSAQVLNDTRSTNDSASSEKPSVEERRFDPPEHVQPPIATEEKPAEPSGDRAETERVLRAALEKLQRMSGAA